MTCTDESFKIRTVNRVMLTIFVLSTEICGAKSVEQMTKHDSSTTEEEGKKQYTALREEQPTVYNIQTYTKLKLIKSDRIM